LLLVEGVPADLRVPKGDRGPLGGLFDDWGELAKAAARLSGKVPGVYVGLNPIKVSLKKKVTNRVSALTAGSAVSDRDIERRRWLPIDFDPIRPPDCPSTDQEHDAAIMMAKDCRKWLREEGWPEPLLADSGNGAQLLYGIDLPNDEASAELVSAILEVLSLKFSDSAVIVDTANFNASRVWRLYGTINKKGEETEERPYRRARLLRAPESMEAVDRALLEALASRLPKPSGAAREGQFDLERWLSDNEVPIVKSAPFKDGGRKWILQCPWNASHRNQSGFLLQFPDGGIDAGCLHESCRGKNWVDFRRIYDKAPRNVVESEAGDQPDKSGATPKSSQTTSLLELASELKFWRTPQGELFATVPVKGHFENQRLGSTEFKEYLRWQYYARTKTAARPQAVQEAIASFEAEARYESPEEEVFVRIAENGTANFLDLCDDRWRMVEFDSDGWRIVEKPTVKFQRFPGMRPLPIPVKGGSIDDLRKFLNLRSDDDWILYVEALLAAVLAKGPYPVLSFSGEPGSAKTTSSRVFRALIDPNRSPSRAAPRSERDLMITAGNSWLLVFDNLSYLSVWFSDALCRLSTGGGFATRKLYSDSDEKVFEAQRPIILNGVEALPTRTDLLDRSLVLDLPVIDDFRDDQGFWVEFEAARPRLLGALLSLAVEALRRRPTVRLPEKSTTRMADFIRLAIAAEKPLGLANGASLRAYASNRMSANAAALDATSIAAPILTLVEREPWIGSAEQLLRKLSTMVDEQALRRKNWPKAPNVLSGMLKRLAPALRNTGVEVEFLKDSSPQRNKFISIKRRDPDGKR
jgi:hypothetical protein